MEMFSIRKIVESHMSRRNIWISFNAHQIFITDINCCEKCVDLGPCSKHLAEPFLRSFRYKVEFSNKKDCSVSGSVRQFSVGRTKIEI